MKRTSLTRKTSLRNKAPEPGKSGLARAKAIKPSRSKPRPGRLKGADMAALRMECFKRDRGLCQHCGKMTNPELDPIYAESMHMAHIRAKRIGGDVIDNVRTLCGTCHRLEHSGGKSMTKPCPRKYVGE